MADEFVQVTDVQKFEIELKALLKKYKAEMSVREGWSGAAWSMVAEGIDVDFEGIYDDDGNLIRPYETLELYRTISGE